MSATDKARDKIREAKEEKLSKQIGKKIQELDKAKKTVRLLEEEIEELENTDLEEVELEPGEGPF